MTLGVAEPVSQAERPLKVVAGPRSAIVKLIARRLVLTPVILVGVTFTVFVMVDLSPHDPATARLGMFASREMREQFAEANGLNDPLLSRYWRFLIDLSNFDFGDSLMRSEPVEQLISRALPVSLQLTIMSVTVAVVLALLLGVISAWREGRAADRVIVGVVSVVHAVPDFWLGLLLIQVFAIGLGLLPSGGYFPMSAGLSLWFSSILGPAVVLALGIMAALTRIIRASMADELAKDYVITARGAGISWPVVLSRNVMRNALVTPITVLGVIVGSLISGAVLVETVFNIPGMGTLLVEAVRSSDLSIVRGVAIVAAAAFVIVNLIVDMLYIVIVPRSMEASER